jgi:flagellar hook-length control protein FliK
MAEMSPTISASQKILAALSDLKGRTGDMSDDNGANFVDVMMARVTAHQNTKDGLKDIVGDRDAQSYTQRDYATDYQERWVDQARHAQASRQDRDKVSARASQKQDHHADRHAIERADYHAAADQKSIDAQKQKQADAVTASDAARSASKTADAKSAKSKGDKAFDGLKDVAKLLLDAEKDGTLSLPENVKAVLEKIAGTEATEAGQALPLLQNLLTVLRKLEDGPAGKDLNKILGKATWGEDIVKLFSDLQVNVGIQEGQPINLGKMIKALRALSHISQSENQGQIEASVPHTAAMPLVMNQEHQAKTQEGNTVVDVWEQNKNKKNKELASDLAGIGLGIPNSQQKPDLNNHPLNPMVKPDRALDAGRDISDAFARGAQQGRIGGDGSAAAGRAATSQMIQSAATSGKEPLFDAPKLDASSSVQSVQGVAATSQAARAAVAAQASLPHAATQQVMVQVQKFPITKDTQLSISLNPAELGRVDVKIMIDQHGKATAIIMADKPETLALLQKDGQHLEKALQQAGLNSSAQDLHYSLKEQAQQREHEAGGRKRRALFDHDENVKPLAVDTQTRDDGLPYRINYHA